MDRAEQHIAYSVMSLRVFIPSLLIAATCAFLVSLGFWQLDRADEKRSIEASIKKANTGTVELIISEDNLERWKYLKGSKKERRTAKGGYEYSYNEGPVAFPEPLDRPSRTIITGEGGNSPSRFKHVVKKRFGKKYRRLTPIELERLNMFPDNHTIGASNIKRAFFMGNALVVGVVEKLGKSLAKRDGL